jgi:hypothetical protein
MMLRRLLDVRKALEHTVTDTAWDAYVNRSSEDIKSQMHMVKNAIMDQLCFWGRSEELVELMSPFYELLRLVDGQKPVVGKLYYKAFEVNILF